MDAMIHAVATNKYQDFVYDAFDPNLDDQTVVETLASEILKSLQANALAKDTKRYKFSKEIIIEKALKAIFDENFKKNGSAIIAAAEALHPSHKPFYSNWKNVYWIQIPKKIGRIVNSPLLQAASAIVFMFGSYVVGRVAYKKLADFTVRSLPKTINNTPIQVIRLYNQMIDLRNFTAKNILPILFVTYVARKIILSLPKIPFVTHFAERIELLAILNIFTSPISIGSFLFGESLSAARFIPSLLTDLGSFIERKAEQVEKEKDAICKAKAYEVWRTIIVQNVRSRIDF